MKYIFLFFFLIIFDAVHAATCSSVFFRDTSKHAVADTDTLVRKQSVSLGVNYGSDIQFFGRTGPIKYPYLSADAIYNFKAGFFVYGSAVQVIGYYPLIDEVDLGAGYLFNYTKKFTGTLSYTRFLFTKDAAQVIRSASSNNIDFKNAYDFKLFRASGTFDYLFGDANDYFVTLHLSKYIETNWSIFDDKDYLSFNPDISMIMGTQNFVGRYTSEHSSQLYFDNNIVGLDVPPPFLDYDNGRFNVLNYSLKLPIAYNRPHYTFEASWKYSIPLHVEGVLKNRHEVFFNLTFYYLFFK